MKRSVVIWLIVAAALIAVGGSLFVGGMMMANWNVAGLSTTQYTTNTHSLEEPIRSIAIKGDTADIRFIPTGEGEGASVVCYEKQNERHTVSVKDGVLTVEKTDTRKWYEHIGIGFGSPRITVSLPAGAYSALSIESSTGDVEIPEAFGLETLTVTQTTGDVVCRASVKGGVTSIRTTTGDIQVSGITAGDVILRTTTGDIRVENSSVKTLELSVTTGRTALSSVTCEGDLSLRTTTGKSELLDVTCKTLRSGGDTGDLLLQNVRATERFSIERSTGDVKLYGCDAAELSILTDTGDVTGTLLSEKMFVVHTDTGRTELPNSNSSCGRCEITTDTGDIRIRLQPN